MNAPVTTAVPGVRPAAPRASDAGRSHSAAPFASALDVAIFENRASQNSASGNRASDRGVERREMRDDRAAEHAAAKDQRAEDRSRVAADRALDEADRTDTRTERAAERTSRRTAGEAAPDGSDPTARRTAKADQTVPGEAVPDASDRGTDAAGTSAEAPRGGLPALWALIMGGSLAGARPEGAVAGPTPPAVAMPGMPATGATAPADAVDPLAARSIASTDLLVDIRPTASAGPVVGAPAGAVPGTVPAPGTAGTAAAATAPAAATGSGLPASFSAVVSASGAVVNDSAAPARPAVLSGAPAPAAPVISAQAAMAAAIAPPAGGAPAAPSIPQGTETGVALPELAGSTDVAVVPVGGASGEALSADADGAGQNSPGSAPAATGTTGPVPATAAVADVDGAARSDPAPPVGSQVARQVAVLRGGPDGAHSMTLVLTPETLGPVEVQVTVTKGSVELALRGAHEQGRAALLDGLPDLRRDLEAAGLSCSRLEVDRETGGSLLDRQPAQQQTPGERSGQPDRGEDRSRPWGRPADSGGSGTSAPQNGSTSSGVDVLV